MKMDRLFATVAFAALALTACVTVEQTSTADGRPAHSITCSGISLSWTDCHERAASICGGKGYAVVLGGQQPGLGISRTEGGLLGGTSEARQMVIQCKG